MNGIITVYFSLQIVILKLRNNSAMPLDVLNVLNVKLRTLLTCAIIELRCEVLVFEVSDQARHKPGCTATEDG